MKKNPKYSLLNNFILQYHLGHFFFFLKKNRGQEEMVLKSMSAVIFLFHEISAQNENILKRSNCQFN